MMPINELRQIADCSWEEHDEQYLASFSPAAAEDHGDFPVEHIWPSDPRYIPLIYVDKSRLGGDLQVDEILQYYERYFPQWMLDIQQTQLGRPPIRLNIHPIAPDAFRVVRLSNWSAAEKMFEKRGFVSPIEMRYCLPGRATDSSFVREHLRWLDVSTFVLSAALQARGTEFFGWEAEFVDSQRDREIREWFMEQKRIEVLGQICGRASNLNPNDPELNEDGEWVQAPFAAGAAQNCNFALVEHEGLLLGCDEVHLTDRVHIAEMLTPLTSLKRNDDAFAEAAPFGRRKRDVAAQIHFEMTRAGAESFFASRHFQPAGLPSDEGFPDGEAFPAENVSSADAILTWYSQVHAVLRKAAWAAGLPEHPTVATNELRREADVLQEEGARRRPTPVGARGPVYRLRNERDRDPMFRIFAAHMDMFTRPDADLLQADQVRSSLTGEQRLIARLHGMLVETADGDEPPEASDVVARWIGRLKREGQQSICWLVADALCKLQDNFFCVDSFFCSLLSRNAWLAVIEAALRVSVSGEPEEVRYLWSRDLQTPWAVEQDGGGVLTIRGPLLSFPALRSAYWRHKAEIIRANLDFNAPTPR